MKNPFKRFKAQQPKKSPDPQPEVITEETIPDESPAPDTVEEVRDDFIEWIRTEIHGGIERRERNDFFEEYCVYGADDSGALICRSYHRYPEHEKEFDLTYSRALTFDELNRRLLSDLDKGYIKLDDYNLCILRADPSSSGQPYSGFTDEESAALQAFCDSVDTLKDKGYLHTSGTLRCESESVVDNFRLNIWFRKPLLHDAMNIEIAGVKRESVNGYDIDNLWIMSVYNRLRERCASCKVTLLSSEWSLEHEAVYLLAVESFDGIDGTLLIALGEADNFRRFGFFSLDYLSK